MKKYLITILLIVCLFIVGCGKNNNKDVLNELTKKISNLKSYQLDGNLEIVNNNDVFNYEVKVDFKDKDYFKVSLKNIANKHEQIILRNDDGVYVVTPSLNKSFKFQSEWPYNNSQVYLLKSIIGDINNDKDSSIIDENDDYVITSKVAFSNNKNLVKQKVTVDKNLLIKKVEILNEDNIPLMTFVISSINYKPIYDENYFEINSIINNTDLNTENDVTTTLDDVIYPLYVPTGTVLSDEQKVDKTNGERVILTFSGDKSFTLVEETIAKEKEFAIIPTYGEPYMLIDTVASLSENSINWVSKGIEYYIVSDVMNQSELIEVAKSINVISVLK